jgi:hypothetical protein
VHLFLFRKIFTLGADMPLLGDEAGVDCVPVPRHSDLAKWC